MMRRFLSIRQDDSGIGAVEFALVVPVLLLAIIGVVQLGVFYFANAGLRNALGEGARYATIFPRPTDTQIKARIAAKEYGLNAANLSTPTLVTGTSNGTNYIDISMTYTVPLDFVLFDLPPVTITGTRRAYVQPVT